MAEYKLYNLKDPKTGQEETQISSKEEFDTIKQKVPSSSIKNPRTGQEGNAETVVKESDMNPGDGRNVAMDVAKCLRDALREHGDEMKAIYLSNSTNEGVTIKIQYMPDEQGQADEDEFVFRWKDGTLKLDNVANPVELCQLRKQSGTVIIQKDLVKANLLKFLQSHDEVEGDGSQPVDPNALPTGPVAEEQLWESEECKQAFCDAVDMYRKAKNKDSIKSLLKAARPYQKGNTIQEKLKGAVDWYNIYTQKPPKNTREQIFLETGEDDSDGDLFVIIKSLAHYLHELKLYIKQTENIHLGHYYSPMMNAFENLYKNYLGWDENELKEVWDVNDPIANGEPTNYPFGHDDELLNWNEDFDDEPAVNEGDEFGPEVGDDVDYQGTHYRLYGYCGYEVVLQNVDDERDFKVVKPEDVGVRDKQHQDIEETNWVDPDRLPEGKACGA